MSEEESKIKEIYEMKKIEIKKQIEDVIDKISKEIEMKKEEIYKRVL
ncbi:MAG: hypothetical protein NO475_03450 [Candidatus Methanomethylicia archaeon]|jgi:hypothetical protein|nr:hypothetical protein [Candidatus Methanomethylicia archaeon]MCQ5340358.1 hypothetical protein [Candidatus Methanomethylicia archaeon]NHV45441.1 hypothetical protein [Candidatus Verstraetearchaeota archaeon]